MKTEHYAVQEPAANAKRVLEREDILQRFDLAIPGVCVLAPRVLADARGFFMETYSKKSMSALGLAQEFVQDNHSCSRKGTVRGLHYQLQHAQGKLCRVVVGEVLDVVVDIRTGSPAFGQWVGEVLSAENKKQIWIPPGCAHGFSVLSDSAEFLYKCTDFYHPEDEYGILPTDPALGIDWRVARPLFSEKDGKYPLLSEVEVTRLPKYRGNVEQA
jgi:dTDP-4-dehydrorhamnose 3,5-epimerase